MAKEILTIPMFIDTMETFGIEVRFYIDRLRFYTDAQTHNKKLDFLIDDNKENDLFFTPLPKREHLNKLLDLHQPSDEVLIALANDNIIEGAYAINYIEFAMDFLVPNEKVTDELSRFFDKHQVQKLKKSSKADSSNFHFTAYCECKDEDGEALHCEEGSLCQTRYYKPEVSKVRLAMYSDRPSKTDAGSSIPCVHIEKRIEGLTNLKNENLYTFKNINHHAFWEENLNIMVPNITELGRKDPNESKSKQWSKNKNDDEGTPPKNHSRGKTVWKNINILQRYLETHASSFSAFKKINSQEELEKQLSKFLTKSS